MRLKALALLWIGGAMWLWRTAIMLPPTCHVETGWPIVIGGFTNKNELAVYWDWEGRDAPNRGPYQGPIEFWKFPEGIKVRETFTSGDHIISKSIPPTGEIVIERAGRFFAANALSEKIIGELRCDVGRPLSPRVLPGGRRLLYYEGPDLRLYDLVAGEELWKAEGYKRYSGIGPGFLVVFPIQIPLDADGKPRSHSVVEALRLKTGEHDDRFDDLGVLHQVRASPDSRFALVRADRGAMVCDSLTGEVLWELPEQSSHGNFRFENSGRELCRETADRDGELIVARWKASDGTVITPAAPEENYGARFHARGARYCVDHTSTEQNRLVSAVNQWLAKWQWLQPFQIDSSSQVYRIRDLDRDVALGAIAREFVDIHLAPDGTGCVVGRDRGTAKLTRFDYYSFPPSRNWGWLMRWGLGPPLVVLILLRGWRRFRRDLKSEASDPPQPSPPAPVDAM